MHILRPVPTERNPRVCGHAWYDPRWQTDRRGERRIRFVAATDAAAAKGGA